MARLYYGHTQSISLFRDPCNCKHYKVPIGLVEMKGHTALQVVTHTEGLMNMVGFLQKTYVPWSTLLSWPENILLANPKVESVI